MSTELDHITVVAPTLEAGAQFIWRTLGVDMQPGGMHPCMGTHNLLLSLGPTAFLEVISIAPGVASPPRARWFGLDALGQDFQPYLAAWVVRTQDIQASSAACAHALGPIERVSRGANHWLITVPQDGSLPMGGAAPALIEWQSKPHPAQALPNADCILAGLDVFHTAPQAVEAVLQSLQIDVLPSVRKAGRTSLVAHIQTPLGRRTLSA